MKYKTLIGRVEEKNAPLLQKSIKKCALLCEQLVSFCLETRKKLQTRQPKCDKRL